MNLKHIKRFNENFKVNESSDVIIDEIELRKNLKIGNIKGGNLLDTDVVTELYNFIVNLKKETNHLLKKDTSTPAGGFSGANSDTMSMSKSGIPISVETNGIHRAGYYGFDRPFLIQVKVGGALKLENKNTIIEVLKDVLKRYTFESSLGKSWVNVSRGTNWSSVMIVAPQKNDKYTKLPSLQYVEEDFNENFNS